MRKKFVSLIIVIILLLNVMSCYAYSTNDTSFFITLSEELSQGKITRFNISSKKDEIFNVVITAKNISDFSGKQYVLSYQSDALDVENLFKQPNALNYVNILENSPGKIEFAVSNNLVKFKKYSGTINIFEFRCKKENAVIELYEKTDSIIEDISVQVSYTNDELTIYGDCASVDNLNIAVMTENNLSIMSDTVNCDNGKYSKTFEIPGYFYSGKYCIKISGTNLVTKYHYFDYVKEKESSMFENTENVILNAKRNINDIKVSGKYTGIHKIPLPVAFYDTQDKLIDFRQISVDENNEFEYNISIGDDWEEGRYNVVASGQYVKGPEKYSFYFYKTPTYEIDGNITADKNEMRIIGNIGAEKKMVTACIKNEFGDIIQFEQFQSDENGEFDKTFVIKKYMPYGNYQLVLSGEKTLSPVALEFEYDFYEYYLYPEFSVDTAKISNTSFNVNVFVEPEFNDRILITVKDDNDNVIAAKQINYKTKNKENGENVSFAIKDTASEWLNVTVSGYYLEPQTISVENPVYNPYTILEIDETLEE